MELNLKMVNQKNNFKFLVIILLYYRKQIKMKQIKTAKMKKNKIIDLILNHRFEIWSNPKRISQTQVHDCEYCGKKASENPLYVHIMTSGIIVPNKIRECHIDKIGQQSQGCFPIHDKCAKDLMGDFVEDYTFRYNTIK